MPSLAFVPARRSRVSADQLVCYRTFSVSDADRADTGNLGFLLAKASQHWNELLAKGFAERGFGEVRPSYGSVLLPLFEEDGLRMGQIAERARLSKQTMTTLVRLCERDGFVYYLHGLGTIHRLAANQPYDAAEKTGVEKLQKQFWVNLRRVREIDG